MVLDIAIDAKNKAVETQIENMIKKVLNLLDLMFFNTNFNIILKLSHPVKIYSVTILR